MVSSLTSFTIFLLIISISISIPPIAYCMGGFSIDLLHHNSQKSNLLASKSTSSSRLKVMAERSLARAIYFRDSIQKINSSFASNTPNIYNIVSEISSIGLDHFMTINIGSPAKEFPAIISTASDLIWVQCKHPNKPSFQNSHLFNPKESSTYKDILCHTDICSTDLKKGCGPESQCEYKYKYADMSDAEGYLATDTFRFHSNDNHLVTINSIIFGCNHHTSGSFNEHIVGFVGLGGGKHSLIRQLGPGIQNKFSYCLPSIKNTSSTSKLNLGSNAMVSGPNSKTMTLFTNSPSTFYFLSLEMISVEGQGNVIVKTGINRIKGNIIIDSGTTLTLIDKETLKSLESKVLASVKLPNVADPHGNFNLCFKASEAKLPDITFHFSNSVEVLLRQKNTFIRPDKETVCLALVSNHGIGYNIFGNLAQQDFHIGYDLNAMKLTMAPMDCAKL